MAQQLSLIDMVNKYDETGPYYTSYPTLGDWSDDFEYTDYVRALEDFCENDTENSFSFYVHFPFCVKICHFCICHALPAFRPEKKKEFLTYLYKEIDWLTDFFKTHGYKPNIKEIHLGGGSPSFMDLDDFDILIDKIHTLVDPEALDEFAMEIDPRNANPDSMRYYATKGIDRISMGIQDFDPDVQEAVGRVQSVELVRELLTPDIRKLYRGLNFDLLYGLPLQTHASFRKSVEIVMSEFDPDRITLLKYAHVPHLKKHMRIINEADILPPDEKAMMFMQTVDILAEHGYEHVGIDNFAKSTDALATAFDEQTVWRNFIGFTPGRVKWMIGVGPSATSSFGSYYSQSDYALKDYYAPIERGEIPIIRGYKMTHDDLVRREVIFRILCDRRLVFEDIGTHFGIDFSSYFSQELPLLAPFAEDGLLEIDPGEIRVTRMGRFCARHIARVFDANIAKKQTYQVAGTTPAGK